jgi:hypothetical protein
MAALVMSNVDTWSVTAVCPYCGGSKMTGVHYMDAVSCTGCGTMFTITALKAKQMWKPPQMTREKAIALNNGA